MNHSLFTVTLRRFSVLCVLALMGFTSVHAENSRPIRVACIGDSITFGLGIADRIATYPAQLQLLLGSHYVVKNFGRSGSTVTRESVNQWPRGYIKQPECAAALAFQPDVVICNLGINDVSDFAAPHRGQFVRDYLEIIAAFRALPTKPRFILWHPVAPLFPGHAYYGSAVVKEINALLAEVATRSGAPTMNLFAPLAEHPEWFPDHIHPNATGARQIAEVTHDFLVSHPATEP